MDVLLLADVFENFLDAAMAHHCLDPGALVNDAVFDLGLLPQIHLSRIGTDYGSESLHLFRQRDALWHFGDSNRFARANNAYLKAED
jgi:hypothetical protein